MRRRRATNQDRLTPREWEVLDLLRDGLTNEQIAERLGISFATAKYHVGEILSKLGVGSREEAALWRPESAQRHWLGAWVFVAALRKMPLITAGKAASVSVIAAGIGGLLLLAIGVVSVSNRHAETSLGKVAYVQDGDVWVKELPDGDPYRITTGGNYFRPEWSPSGRWLTVFREREERDPEVFVVSADGQIQRELESPASWAPRQDRLAYLVDHIGARGSVIVEDADGSNREVVAASSDDRQIWRMAPGWSPDGKWLAFFAQVPQVDPDSKGRNAIFRVRVNGSDVEELFAYDLPNLSLTFRGWSPDGKYLLLSMQDGPVDSSDGLTATRMVPIALDGRSSAVEQPELTIFDVLVELSGSSDIGLVLGADDQWERLALYNPGAGDVSYLTSGPERAFHPDWSPDGSQIVYAGNRTTESARGQHIWISEADGSAARELTSDDTYLDEWPRWSANGTEILFTRLSLEGDRNAASLWLLDLKSGELIQIASLDPPWLSAFRSVRMFGGGPYHRQWEQSVDWWRGR